MWAREGEGGSVGTGCGLRGFSGSRFFGISCQCYDYNLRSIHDFITLSKRHWDKIDYICWECELQVETSSTPSQIFKKNEYKCRDTVLPGVDLHYNGKYSTNVLLWQLSFIIILLRSKTLINIVVARHKFDYE